MVSAYSSKISLNEVAGVSRSSIPKNLRHVLIGEKYMLIKKLGSGSFGDVYSAKNVVDSKSEVRYPKSNFSFVN